mgnify:FL=1
MFIKIKWIPALLFFGGLILLFSGEATVFSVLLMLAGGIFFFLQLSKKYENSSKTQANQVGGISNPVQTVSPTIASQQVVTVQPLEPAPNANGIKCPQCGYMESEGSTFCSSCGSKLVA